jgi:hypothetical protein
MQVRPVLLALLLTSLAGCHSEDHPRAKLDHANQTELNLFAASLASHQRVQFDLTRAQLQRKLDLNELEEEEREHVAWRANIDAQVALEVAEYTGGSIAPLVESTAQAREYGERMLELQARIDRLDRAERLRGWVADIRSAVSDLARTLGL